MTSAEIARNSSDIKHLDNDIRRIEGDSKDTAKLATNNAKNIALMQGSIEETRQEVHIMRSDFDDFRQEMKKEIKEIKDTHAAKTQVDHTFQCETSATLQSLSDKMDRSHFNIVKVFEWIASNPKTGAIMIFCFAIICVSLAVPDQLGAMFEALGKIGKMK